MRAVTTQLAETVIRKLPNHPRRKCVNSKWFEESYAKSHWTAYKNCSLGGEDTELSLFFCSSFLSRSTRCSSETELWDAWFQRDYLQLESGEADRAGGPTKYRLHFIWKVNVPGKECWWQEPRKNPLSDMGVWHIAAMQASTLRGSHVTGPAAAGSCVVVVPCLFCLKANRRAPHSLGGALCLVVFCITIFLSLWLV